MVFNSMKRVMLLVLVLFVVSCSHEIEEPAPVPEEPEHAPEQATPAIIYEESDTEEKTMKIETADIGDNAEEAMIELVQETKEEPTLVNGKTTEERLNEAYTQLHQPGSSQHTLENFPDFEIVFVDEGDGSSFPDNIYPFEYHYSKEADKTFSICAIHRTVFICDGKLDHLITDEEMNSEKCTVTPIYRER